MMQVMNSVKKEGLGALEEILSALIEPVNPDPEFVSALKLKLSQAPTVILESGNKHLPFLAAATGLAAGLLIFWLLINNRKPIDE